MRVVRFSCLLSGNLSVLIVGWLALMPCARAMAQGPPGGQPPAPVRVAVVEERELNLVETFVGTVLAKRTSMVGSEVEGRVVELSVNEGDRVQQNQPLARLRSTTLEIELRAAKAELELRKQELAELENGSRPEEIAQAEARVKAAESLKKLAAAKLKRAERLFKEDMISEDELEEKVSAAEAADNVFLEQAAGLKLARLGPRAEKIEQARARVVIQQETIRRVEDDIQRHTILAPFDGHVTMEHSEVGQWIAKGGAVVTIVELDEVDIEVPVPEIYASRVEVGLSANVQFAALPETPFSGTVALMVPQADVRSRSFPVKVRLTNREGNGGQPMLKPGMFARVMLPVGGRGKALLIPKDALVLGDRTTVWVVDPVPQSKPPGMGKVRPVPVSPGVSDGGLIEVRGSLKAGEIVIIEGNERIFNPTLPVMMLNPPKSDN